MRARTYKSIVVLTGAGISAESGIRTFRAADGLWEEHRVEEVATPEGFAANPSLVQRFYNERRAQLLSGDIHPNAAHEALAHLEHEFEGKFLLVTQNIDDLHERAGTRNLIHMHGELLKMRCARCDHVAEIRSAIDAGSVCGNCERTATLRPHIVWFGEMPMQMDTIYRALMGCDLFLSIGTSGNVYPAAGFVQEALQAGAHTIEINLEPSSVHSSFHEHIYGKAGEVLPGFVAKLLARS